MKRVLFVDDEPKALEDLKLMLQVQEFPWEAAFASSGKSALDLDGGKTVRRDYFRHSNAGDGRRRAAEIYL